MTELETPFPYQTEGAAFLAQRSYAFIADEMGLGKTAQAVIACDTVGASTILVICPASVKWNWEREFDRFSPMGHQITIIETAKDPIPPTGVVVVSYDMATILAHKLKARYWDVLIVDEAHYLKERSAKRTKAIYGRGVNYPGVAAKAKRVWCLSGTPAPNHADELYTHVRAAGLTNESYWDFTFRYCSGFESDFGFKITGHKNTEELKATLKKFMLRRTNVDVKNQLPPLDFQQIFVERSHVELDPHFFEQIRGRRITEAQFFGELKVADTTLRSALQSVYQTRTPNESRLTILEGMQASSVSLRRFIGLAKVGNICNIIKDELANNAYDKIVLFAVHQSVIEEARAQLADFDAVTLYGKTPLDRRQKNIKKFMTNPKCRVFIGNIEAAGTGIDGLQKVACEVAFLEQDWVPSKNAQAVMRVHRYLQDRPVRVRIFTMRKSSDELVQETLLRKARELTKIF